MKPFLKNLERRARDGIAVILGKVLSPEKITADDLRRRFEAGEIKKILLVRTYQGLGDLLCTTPVAASLKASFPEISIHFLANTFNQAALEGNPKVDRIWAWDERRAINPLGWIRLLKGLRKERFDLALVLSGNALSLTAILLARFSGARWVIGYETQSYGKPWGRSLYSCELPNSFPVREIDKFLGLLAALGLPTPKRQPEYFVTALHRAYAETYLKQNFPAQRPLLGIFLGGKVDRPERIWPPEFYAESAQGILESFRCDLVLIAPPQAARARHKRETSFWMDEEIHERKFQDAYGKPSVVFREAQLGRVAALIQRLSLLICPDGGIMHLAAALGTPTLTLFFGTDPDVWHPPVASSHYLRALEGPRSLRPESVIEQAKRLLGCGIKTA